MPVDTKSFILQVIDWISPVENPQVVGITILVSLHFIAII